jgi:hypothetical protein
LLGSLLGCSDEPEDAAPFYDEAYASIGVDRIERMCEAILDRRTIQVNADLIEVQPQIEYVLYAAGLERCTYPHPEELDSGHTPAARLRDLSVLIYGDGVRLSRLGDGAAAADRGAAIVRIAVHAAQGGDRVSKRVAAAALSRASIFVLEHAPKGRGWNAEEAAVLQAEFSKLDEHDPFGNEQEEVVGMAARARANALSALGR